MDDFEIIRKLGEGAFSSVFLVKRRSDGKEYAMKKVNILSLSQREKENAVNEVRILASINNPNIIGYKEVFLEEEPVNLCIVMEFANGGDLMKKIAECKNTKILLPEEVIWKYIVQMVYGIKSLHDLGILHRDLKSANIFLTQDGTIKIGDLNVSKISKCNLAKTQTGTPYYASPEVWKGMSYDKKCDIWSMGCVIYELCALVPPFRSNTMVGLYNKIIKGQYDRIPFHYSNALANFISSCLQVSPTQRPTCQQLLENPFIQKYSPMVKKPVEHISDKMDLLKTIILPKDFKDIVKQLPKPNYTNGRILSCRNHPNDRAKGEGDREIIVKTRKRNNSFDATNTPARDHSAVYRRPIRIYEEHSMIKPSPPDSEPKKTDISLQIEMPIPRSIEPREPLRSIEPRDILKSLEPKEEQRSINNILPIIEPKIVVHNKSPIPMPSMPKQKQKAVLVDRYANGYYIPTKKEGEKEREKETTSLSRKPYDIKNSILKRRFVVQRDVFSLLDVDSKKNKLSSNARDDTRN